MLRDAYAELDAQQESQKTRIQMFKERLFGKAMKTLNGDRIYQTDTGGHHPVDGYPCYVDWVAVENAAPKNGID